MITIRFTHQPFTHGSCGVCVFSNAFEDARGFDEKMYQCLQHAQKTTWFKAKHAEVVEILDAQQKYERIVFAGLGTSIDLSHLNLYEVGGALMRHMLKTPASQLSIMAPSLTDAQRVDLAFGLYLRQWRFNRLRTNFQPHENVSLTEICIVADHPEEAQKRFDQHEKIIADCTMFARDLAASPGNILTPESFKDEIVKLQSDGLEVEVLDRAQLTEMGAHALLGVAQGSEFPPYLVVMRWKGSAIATEAPVALVGKGVTFDSGGLSLKPANAMMDMKQDMTGAAVVTAVMRACALRKVNSNVVGCVALVENMPSGRAQRPGDVVKTLSGKTVEVLNTDAEGRLILIDALWYIQKNYQPRWMIDVATLTGAIHVALGNAYAGLFSNDENLTHQLLSIGKDVGEELWHMPLHDDYDKAMRSPIADFANIPHASGVGAGSATAAQFLKNFVNNTPWAHIDIAGVDFVKEDKALTPKGPNAFGVRLLSRLIDENAQK